MDRQHCFGAASGPLLSVIVVCMAGVIACAICLILWAAGLDWVAALRDASRGDGLEAGLISNIGIAMMSGAVVVLILALIRQFRLSVLFLAGFCALFALDDGLMLHEKLNDLEIVVFPFYAALLSLAWLAFARELGVWIIWPIAGAFAAFAVSVVTDQLWYSVAWQVQHRFELSFMKDYGDLRYLLEDIPKFAGLSLIVVLSVGEATNTLRAPRSVSGTPDRD